MSILAKRPPQNPDSHADHQQPDMALAALANSLGVASLPDFRNLGVCLRLILIVNLMLVFAALLNSQNLQQTMDWLISNAFFVQPPLLMSLTCLYLASPWLTKLPYAKALAIVLAGELGLIALLCLAEPYFFLSQTEASMSRNLLLAAMTTGLVLYYFSLRYRALSPALTEARLQALQARIRPHFLFNCINGVLSILRTEPKRAETALEDMADLFRVLMADNRELVPLAKEIALCKQYLALETMRLGERLYVEWQISGLTETELDAVLMPPLILQPLLENAVYHGIEPMAEGGKIVIRMLADDSRISISIENPLMPITPLHHGNKMALTNIRQRLALHYDAEASLMSKQEDRVYQVHIQLPRKHLLRLP